MTWSNPINVSTDTSTATAILLGISVDPTTGVVAVSWQDARGSETDEDVNKFGVFLDPRELKRPFQGGPITIATNSNDIGGTFTDVPLRTMAITSATKGLSFHDKCAR
jgi:hypothetical protein